MEISMPYGELSQNCEAFPLDYTVNTLAKKCDHESTVSNSGTVC